MRQHQFLGSSVLGMIFLGLTAGCAFNELPGPAKGSFASPVMQDFHFKEVLRPIVGEEKYLGSSSEDSQNGRMLRHYTARFTLDIPFEGRAALFKSLKERLEQVIRDAGGVPDGGGSSSGQEANPISYRREYHLKGDGHPGDVIGDIMIFFSPADGNRWNLVVVLHEVDFHFEKMIKEDSSAREQAEGMKVWAAEPTAAQRRTQRSKALQ